MFAAIENTHIFQARKVFLIELGFDPVRDCGGDDVDAAKSQG